MYIHILKKEHISIKNPLHVSSCLYLIHTQTFHTSGEQAHRTNPKQLTPSTLPLFSSHKFLLLVGVSLLNFLKERENCSSLCLTMCFPGLQAGLEMEQYECVVSSSQHSLGLFCFFCSYLSISVGHTMGSRVSVCLRYHSINFTQQQEEEEYFELCSLW